MNLKINGLRCRPALNVALAALCTCAFGPTALAQASPTVTLSANANSGNQWEVTGTGFTPGQSNVTVEVGNYATLAIIESQTDISTSALACTRVVNTVRCNLAGAFTALGATYTGGWLRGFPVNPLTCSTATPATATGYIAIVSEPGVGFVASNVVTVPGCPVQ